MAHHRKQIQRPETDIRLADFTRIGEQSMLIDIGENVFGLNGFQAGEKQLKSTEKREYIHVFGIISLLWHTWHQSNLALTSVTVCKACM